MKTINKPWGREEWLEQNERYCFKKIYIERGKRTSLQYHNLKHEACYVLSGKIEVWLEDWDETIKKTVMVPGDYFSVEPLKRHRVVGLEDSFYLEASTPEVEDVVRIEDDFFRR